jgi:cellulose synthase/poly-beta-1,6-N-acetylglucosamine synthase-like glycosyltransferase
VLYPLWLALRTRNLVDPAPPEPVEWPALTVVVPAYRERSVIVDKIHNTFENGYPGQLEVVVVAEDADTYAAAQMTKARVIGEGHRRGKAGALNLGVAAARTPIVVLTDANSMLEPGTLALLVRWLADSTIGAVAGEKRVAGGEGVYWAFESWLKRREWRTGTTIGIGGELVAVRRDAYVELPTDIAVDDLWLALDVIEGGHRVAYEPAATAYETEGPTLGADWERRTRIVAGTLDALWRRRSMLLPGRPAAGQLWGHRLVRSTVGPAAHAVLVAVALWDAPRSFTARFFLGVNALGGWSYALDRGGVRTTMLSRALGQAVFLQAVGVGGTIRFLRGDHPARWPKPERPDGDGGAPTATTSS